MSDDLEHFRALRFLFVCDKLDPAEKVWMEDTLAKNPQLLNEVEADRKFMRLAREALDEQQVVTPPLVNLNAILRTMEARQSKRPSIIDWLSGWLDFSSQKSWAIAGVAFLAVTSSIQTYRLGISQAELDQANLYRSTVQIPQPTSQLLKVIFIDSITAGELRNQLPALKLDIVRGPDEQGFYWLAVREGSAQQVIKKLRDAKLVLDAQLVSAAN